MIDEEIVLEALEPKRRFNVRGDSLSTQKVTTGTLHGIKPCPASETQRRVETRERVFEQFWHKTAATLFAAGYDSKQVAEMTGKCVSTISDLRHTSWFQEQVTKIIMDNGGKDMIETFRRDATEAHALLVELRQNEKTPVQYRVKLATDAVERYYGKATQRIEHGEIKSDDPVAEVERLKRENELLHKAQQPSLS